MIDIKRALLLLGFMAALCGCQDRVQSKLEKIDSLLTQDNVDAAYMYLHTLPPILPENKRDIAYYTLGSNFLLPTIPLITRCSIMNRKDRKIN